VTRRYINHFFFFTDVLQYRTNFFIGLFVANPAWAILAAFNNQFDQTHVIPICIEKERFGVYISKMLLFLPLWVPFFFALYFLQVNELRLFNWSENNGKQ
jgi:hypothetical protein